MHDKANHTSTSKLVQDLRFTALHYGLCWRRYARMKYLFVLLSFAFCLTCWATSITVYSVGISSAEFTEQGGVVERESDSGGLRYRINLDNFESCSPENVVAKAMANEKAMLSLVLENKGGWYKFTVPSGLEGKGPVVLQVYCKEGIPLRNAWL